MRYLIHTIAATLLLAGAAGQVRGQELPTGSELSSTEARRQSRLFDEHVVRPGETAFSIARGYAISPLTLAADNPGVDLTRIGPGRVLLVRRRDRGRTSPEQVNREWQQLIDGNATRPTSENATGTITTGTLSTAETPSETTAGELPVDPPESPYASRSTTPGHIPEIAIMLPFAGSRISTTAGSDFTDFYKGALLALEDLKARGQSANVTLYNSARSAEKMQSIVASAEFVDTDLIIGPVYEEEMEPAVRFGEYFGVPVVSPLAAMRYIDGETLYQMAPDPGAKYDKLRGLFEGNTNIILVSSGADDDIEFRSEIIGELGARNYGRFTIGGAATGSARGTTSGEGEIASLIDWERENVLIVLAGSEGAVDRALATIASSYNNASARRSRRAAITVIGSSRWAGYGASVDENLFFKLGVKFVTNYYINRSDRRVALFETRYFDSYGSFPSRASLRGYDAVSLFAGALFERGSSFADRLARVGDAPLGTPYRFVRRGRGNTSGGTGGYNGTIGGTAPDFGVELGSGNIGSGGTDYGGTRRYVNDQWTLVSFSNDYNITIQ